MPVSGDDRRWLVRRTKALLVISVCLMNEFLLTRDVIAIFLRYKTDTACKSIGKNIGQKSTGQRRAFDRGEHKTEDTEGAFCVAVNSEVL